MGSSTSEKHTVRRGDLWKHLVAACAWFREDDSPYERLYCPDKSHFTKRQLNAMKDRIERVLKLPEEEVDSDDETDVAMKDGEYQVYRAIKGWNEGDPPVEGATPSPKVKPERETSSDGEASDRDGGELDVATVIVKMKRRLRNE